MELRINKNIPLIMHIDLNSCFATIEQQANPLLRGKPIVVAAYETPNGCVLAPSIEAKRLGIKTGMRVKEARLLCPDVIVRSSDPEKYRDVHQKFKKIFTDYSDIVVPKSIDEAVIDFRSMERLKLDLVEIAKEIKQRMKKEIGEWIICSVGISVNRFLAKLAASLHKPDGLDLINHKNIEKIYGAITLLDLNGINLRFQARLNAYGIFTPLDFLNAECETLQKNVFKSVLGRQWYERIRGYEVDDVEFKTKSIGQEYALKEWTSDPRKICPMLMKPVSYTHLDVYKRQPIHSASDSLDLYNFILDLPGDVFSLTVHGDSMIDASIREGDIAIINPNKAAMDGDIVAALVDGECTLKYFYKDHKGVRLVPANPEYPIIYPETELIIQGVVLSLIHI